LWVELHSRNIDSATYDSPEIEIAYIFVFIAFAVYFLPYVALDGSDALCWITWCL